MISRYSRPEMKELWSEEAKYKLWLEVEVIAMEAMEKEGIIPSGSSQAVRSKGKFEISRIEELDAKLKHDTLAFLTNVSEHVGEEARYLHYGMTSSDLIDTAFSVQLCRATDIILKGISDLKIAIKKRAEEHKYTLCMGRSHGIHAEPTTFGLKLAGFHAEIARFGKRIAEAKMDVAVGAISGPVGTYSQLPPSIESYVCKNLGLLPSSVSTQVIPRDVHSSLFLSFAGLATSLEHLAIEIRHLQRTEVREAEEFFSKGQKGSSAMPHKRNPVLSENITGLARVVRNLAVSSLENISLWHERDISHSSVERFIAPDVTITLDFMLGRMKGIIENLLIYPDRMRYNIGLTKGLIYSATLLLKLSEKGISREKAYDLVQGNAMRVWDQISGGDISQSDIKDFKTEVSDDKVIMSLISSEELEEVFSEARFTKHVDYIFDRVFGA
ncbi:MAG TPA: adenylosuccinate lyase [Oligoflexia bacterium]|nr:adenylosuccinate lyase [Oligoflexia bacterium]HMP47898.1 adenylosuccinate lyase [Oligoflexia bacterium]